MPRLRSLGPRVQSLPATLPTTAQVTPNYGKGRGGRPWRRLRKSILERDQYLCQPCKAKGRFTLATEVDHVIPQAEGGADDRVNLQSICDPCHTEKTKAESARGITRAFGRS